MAKNSCSSKGSCSSKAKPTPKKGDASLHSPPSQDQVLVAEMRKRRKKKGQQQEQSVDPEAETDY